MELTNFRKWGITSLIFFMFLAMGLCCDMIGPTFQLVMFNIQANYRSMSRATTGRDYGFFAGTLISGFIVPRFFYRVYLVMAFVMLLLAAATILIPYSTHLVFLALCFIIQGFSEGFINVGALTILLRLWNNSVSAPLTFVQAGVGFGALSAPQVARPFLNLFSTHNDSMQLLSSNDSAVNSTEPLILPFKSLLYPYLIAASTPAVLFLAFLILGILKIRKSLKILKEEIDKLNLPKERKSDGFSKEEAGKSGHSNRKGIISMIRTELDNAKTVLTVSLLFLSLVCSVGQTRTIGQFLFSYVRDEHEMSVNDASKLSSVFWACYLSGRLLTALICRWIPTRWIILCWPAGSLAFNCTLCFIHSHSTNSLWVALMGNAFFLSGIAPNIPAYGNTVLETDGLLLALISLGCPTGGFSVVSIMGVCYESYGPDSFAYVITGASALLLCLTGIVRFIRRDGVKTVAATTLPLSLNSLANSSHFIGSQIVE